MSAPFAIDVLSIFPELFPGPLSAGLVGKAFAAGRATLSTLNPRELTTDKHKKVDDEPYGGGAGLVMKPEPLVLAIEAARARTPGPVLLLSPQGRPLAQADLARWAAGPGLVIVCGRYEGYDERIRRYADESVSLGDFVLTGGELGALLLIDGVVRLLPGTLGNVDSSAGDSFSQGLLEFAQYTRPAEFRGERVPDVLISGHHAEVAAHRQRQSLLRTHAQRPDLLLDRGLSEGERAGLKPLGAQVHLALDLGGAGHEPGLAAILSALKTAYGLAQGPAPEGALVLGVGPGPEPRLGPGAVRQRLAQQPLLLQLGPGPVQARLPLRPGLPLGLQAAVALDRILGEA